MATIPDTLSDYDLQELIAFDSKVQSEGFDYAAGNYGPRFEFADYASLDYGTLRTLWRTHATIIENWWHEHDWDGPELHNAHVDESRRRREDRCLWGVRFANGNSVGCDTEGQARSLAAEPSWNVAAVLSRDEAGGEWKGESR